MDGNGRWAKRRGLPRVRGHVEGVKSVERVIDFAKKVGIPYLTFYAFSTENWKRPKEEVQFLMELLREYLKEKLPIFLRDNIRVSFIGRRDRIPRETLEWMEKSGEGNGEVFLHLGLCGGGLRRKGRNS